MQRRLVNISQTQKWLLIGLSILIGGVVLFISTTVLFFVVLSHNKQATRHTYDTVNEIATQLNPSTIGSVIHEAREGTGGFSSDPPTLDIIVVGSNSYTLATERLASIGFTSLGGDEYWQHGTPPAGSVSLSRVKKGATVTAIDTGENIVMPGDGIIIEIRS